MGAFIASIILAQAAIPQCGPLPAMLDLLRIYHKEFVTIVAKDVTGKQTLWTVSYDGSWTQLSVDEKQVACMTSAGTGMRLDMGT